VINHPNYQNKKALLTRIFIDSILNNDEFNKKWGDLGPIYGKQWVAWEKINYYDWGSFDKRYRRDKDINQVQQVIDTLRTNPDSRRMLVSAWNPADIDDMILPPCHWAYEFYTEELTDEEKILNLKKAINRWSEDGKISDRWGELIGQEAIDAYNMTALPKRKISLKWHQRSVDVPLGLPFNIASYAFLLEMVAQQVNMVPHMLVGDLSNVHIYKDQLDGVKEQLDNFTYKYQAPKLKLNKADDLFSYKLEDFEIEGYESYPTIKFPLSN
jgi:thymidylate synthase